MRSLGLVEHRISISEMIDGLRPGTTLPKRTRASCVVTNSRPRASSTKPSESYSLCTLIGPTRLAYVLLIKLELMVIFS